MLANIQGGYINLPSFSQIRRFVEWNGENFEWVLVVVLLVGLMLSSWHDNRVTKMVVEQPLRNDFFFVDYFAIDDNSDAKYRYIPMRVMEVKENSLVFKVGNVGQSKKLSPSKHVKSDRAMHPNYYRKESLELTLKQISELFESHAIYAAVRPRNIYINGWIVMKPNEL
ncbi:hypothetical protein [Paraglaciecola arctica]|uniref:hypothetical protein n=1 Tax=Paraglaciecola arctica TaxID=1128911 RepID=UPI001C0689E6|nr:hypothetical protein [Paraglaciecola arctica]MBU3004582.1 hypothetical protein [Paraglaciecola arctica]